MTTAFSPSKVYLICSTCMHLMYMFWKKLRHIMHAKKSSSSEHAYDIAAFCKAYQQLEGGQMR